MKRKIILFLILFSPSISYADQGLSLLCLNMLAVFGKKFQPLYYKLEATGFHYFDEKQNKFIIVPSKQLMFREDSFTVKFPDYELGFQKIVFAGKTEPTITMCKYDYKNDKFLDHYKCELEKKFIN